MAVQFPEPLGINGKIPKRLVAMGPAHGHNVATACWCRLTEFAAANGHRDELYFEGMQDLLPAHSQAGSIDRNATFRFRLRINHAKDPVSKFVIF